MDPILPSQKSRLVVFSLVGVLLALVVIDVRWRIRHNHSDWWVYWTVARHIATAPDPYAVPSPGEDYYIYPPLLAILAQPLGTLSSEDAATAWHFLNIALLFGCYVEWKKTWLALGIERGPRWIVLLTAALGAMPVVSTMQGGQVNILNLYMILLGCRLALTGTSWRAWLGAGLALTLPAAIKLSPGLVGAVLLVQFLATKERRRAVLFGGSLLAGAALWLFVIPALFVGWTRNLNLLALWADHVLVTRANMHATSTANQGLSRVVETYAEWIGGTPPRFLIAGIIVTLALAYAIPVALAIRRLMQRGRLLDHLVVTTMAAAASLFYSPVSWHAHYTLALPFVSTAPLYFLDAGRETAARRLACAVAFVFVLHYVLRNFAPATTLPVLGPLFGACVVGFSVAVLREERGELVSHRTMLPVSSRA